VGVSCFALSMSERAEYATKEKGNIGLDSRPICLTLSNYLGEMILIP
jgi:hypothetical protein